jgi:hypothetical protein
MSAILQILGKNHGVFACFTFFLFLALLLHLIICQFCLNLSIFIVCRHQLQMRSMNWFVPSSTSVFWPARTMRRSRQIDQVLEGQQQRGLIIPLYLNIITPILKRTNKAHVSFKDTYLRSYNYFGRVLTYNNSLTRRARTHGCGRTISEDVEVVFLILCKFNLHWNN